jgi:hypothetical protein
MNPRPPRPLKAFLTVATDPRALAWRPMLATLIAYLVLTLIQFGAGLAVLAATVCAWALQWSVMWVANKAFLARAWPRRHPLLAMMILFFVIVIAALLTAGIFDALIDGYTVLWRFALTLVIAALWLLLADYRDDSEAEATVQQALTESRDHGSRLLQREREQVVTTLIENLQEALGDPAQSAAGASTQLRQFARERVRPLSHELMESLPPTLEVRTAKAQQVTWRQVLARVTAVSLVPPLLTALVVTFVFIWRTTVTMPNPAPNPDADGIAVTVDFASLLWSFAGLGLVFVVTFGVAWLVRRVSEPVLPRLSLGRRVAVAVAGPILIAIAIEVAIQLAYLTPMVTQPLRSGFFDRLFLAIPIVIVAFLVVVTRAITQLIATAREQQEQLTADLAWEVARVNETLHQERRYFAMQTHGPIQSAAAVAAARLESVADSESLEQAWAGVYAELEGVIQGLGAGPRQARDVAGEVAGLVAAWEGVCEIEADMSPEVLAALEADWIASASVAEIITEAVGNATMHGSATWIHIDVRLYAPDVVAISVVNNGEPLHDDVASGMGTSVFEDICIEWGRVNAESGVQVWARIPVAVLSTRAAA